jgi:peptide-methionine (S)-S-oxide reductase
VEDNDTMSDATLEKATLGAGCFWCVEAVFQNLPGVLSVVSGYAGGKIPNPTYEQICSGTTGHAEAVRLEFDPARVSFEKILEVFWLSHDPTTLNRQGNDVGTQYRSVIFAHDEKQLEIARRSRETAQANFDRPIVTEITPLTEFFPAEDYHQNYFNNHATAPYCRIVIAPKLSKLRELGVLCS